MLRLENADLWRSFVFQPGCRFSRCGNFLKFRDKLPCASSSRRPSGARSLLEKGGKPSTQPSPSRIPRRSAHLYRRPGISLARPRCARKDGNSVAPCADGTSERRCSSDSCALRRNCCRAAKWKSRADSKRESSARVFPAGQQSPATISRKESERSFLFAAPGEDRQSALAACAGRRLFGSA